MTDTQQVLPEILSPGPVNDAWKRNRVRFKAFLIVYGGLVFWIEAWAIHDNHPWIAGPGLLFASLLIVFVCSWLLEDGGKWKVTTFRADGVTQTRTQLDKLNPKQQSWSFMSDGIGLAPMAGFGTVATHFLHHNTFFGSWWWAWAFIGLTIGGTGAYLFSREEGNSFDPLRRNTYSKLAHNGVAFTVLCGLVVYTLVPIVFTGGVNATAPYSWLAIAGFGIWLICMGADGWRSNLKPDSRFAWLALDPISLHPQGDERGRRILVEIADLPSWNEFHGTHTGEAFDMGDILNARRLVLQITRLFTSIHWRSPRGAHRVRRPRRGRMMPDDDRNRRSDRADDRPHRPG